MVSPPVPEPPGQRTHPPLNKGPHGTVCAMCVSRVGCVTHVMRYSLFGPRRWRAAAIPTLKHTGDGSRRRHGRRTVTRTLQSTVYTARRAPFLAARRGYRLIDVPISAHVPISTGTIRYRERVHDIIRSHTIAHPPATYPVKSVMSAIRTSRGRRSPQRRFWLDGFDYTGHLSGPFKAELLFQMPAVVEAFEGAAILGRHLLGRKAGGLEHS